MAQLNLYYGYTPNTNGNYVYYTSFDHYVTHLSSNLVITISDDNYRINNNSVRVATSAQIMYSNYQKITYMINTADNKCYIVQNSYMQSGCFIFDLVVDLWGTYIGQTSFNMIDVVRCNRRIGTGLYDNIRATKTVTRASFPIPTGQSVTDHATALSTSHAYIVFTVEYAVQSQVFGNISTTEVFCCSLAYIYSQYRGSGGTLNPNAVELACSVIGGITETSTSTWYQTQTARVLRAYLVPEGFVSIVTTPARVTTGFITKSRYGDITIYGDKCILKSSELSFALDNNPNNQYYVGTPESGLKLTRVTDTQFNVTYRCAVNFDRLQITVEQGDNQMDITSNFEVALTLNGGDVTNLAGIKAGLQYGLKTAADVATGNFFGVTSDVLGIMGNHYNGHTINGGDGAIAMSSQHVGGYLDCRYPLGYIACESINNEQENAVYKGAFFDTYMSNFANIFNNYPLMYGTNIPTYIQANVTLSDIPLNAQNTIRNALASGIYMIKV